MYEYSDNLIDIFAKSFHKNAFLPALSLYGQPDSDMSYLQLAERIARTHALFRLLEIKPGERVALCGTNSPRWVITFMATITYGAVVVPILHDFTPADIVNIVNHSQSEILIADDAIIKKLPLDDVQVKAVLRISDGSLVQSTREGFVRKAIREAPEAFAKKYPEGFRPSDIVYDAPDPEEVMIINYTSGTTGFSKGVMLTGHNMSGNVVFGLNERIHYPRSRVLTFLPLAHAYGCTFDMLLPLAAGSHVTILGRTPTPSILLKALGEVRPNIILSVPLVFEKIYSSRIEPMLKSPKMRRLMKIPGLSHFIYSKIRRKLTEALGGCFEEVIIGGAAFSPHTEEFLRRIRFPFTVGYGMTECGPLISYTPWKEYIPTSAGRTLPRMESKVLSDDPEHTPGEILVRGINVMKGYYRNPEATEKVLDKEGWLHTGDVGTRSADGTLFLRGRSKTMILTASGQNIYPEEIEARLGALQPVKECLVIEQGGRLVALIYPDYEMLEKKGFPASKLPDLMEQLRKKANSELAPYEQIQKVVIMATEFQKTPKRSIKRYLYQ